MTLLRVVALREDGSWWGVDVRTLRQARKVARRLRWGKGWPTWIHRLDQPGDRVTQACWQQWRDQRRIDEAWQQGPAVGVH